LGSRDDEENLSIHSLSSLREHLVESSISIVSEEDHCGFTLPEDGLNIILRKLDHRWDCGGFQPLADALDGVSTGVVDRG